jgi:hypothetical protein
MQTRADIVVTFALEHVMKHVLNSRNLDYAEVNPNTSEILASMWYTRRQAETTVKLLIAA